MENSETQQKCADHQGISLFGLLFDVFNGLWTTVGGISTKNSDYCVIRSTIGLEISNCSIPIGQTIIANLV